MNFNETISEINIDAENWADLKNKVKKELKELALKSEHSQLSNEEIIRQYKLNNLKDALKKTASSMNEVSKTDTELSLALTRELTHIIAAQNIEKANLSSMKTNDSIRSNLSTFRIASVKRARVPQFTSTGIFTTLSTLFFIPTNIFEHTFVGTFFSNISISYPTLLVTWMFSLFIMIHFLSSTKYVENEIDSIVATIGNESNMNALFQDFVLSNHSVADMESKDVFFTLSNFTNFIREYFFRNTLYRPYTHFLISRRSIKRRILSNPELLNSFELAAKLQIEKALENEIITVDSKGFEISYKINSDLLNIP